MSGSQWGLLGVLASFVCVFSSLKAIHLMLKDKPWEGAGVIAAFSALLVVFGLSVI